MSRRITRTACTALGKLSAALPRLLLELALTIAACCLHFCIQTFKFCRSKCHRNFKAKRNPRKLKSVDRRRFDTHRTVPQLRRDGVCSEECMPIRARAIRSSPSRRCLLCALCLLCRWTKAFRKAHGKEMVVDSTFEFERLRHRPIKYNRDLMGKTIQAMQRIAEIKAKREMRFWAERMKDNVKKQKALALRDLAQNIELAKPVQESVGRKSQLNQARIVKTKTAEQRAAAKAAKASAGGDDIEE